MRFSSGDDRTQLREYGTVQLKLLATPATQCVHLSTFWKPRRTIADMSERLIYTRTVTEKATSFVAEGMRGKLAREQSRRRIARRSEGESEECCNEGSSAMVQPKQGLSVLKYIPKAMRPTTSDVSSVALWGTTAALGALWLVQPFDWIKQQISGAPAEEQK